MHGGAGAAAAGAAAAANAIKASGAIVRVESEQFQELVRRSQGCVVVHAPGGFFSSKHQYLLAYKGFVFHAKCSEPMPLHSGIETVEARKIWIPG